MAVARTVTRAAADWNVITVGSTMTRSPAPDTAGQRHTITRTRWNTQPLASGHLALFATARTFIFSNIDFHVYFSRNGGEFAAPNIIELIHLLQILEKKIHGKLFSLVPCSMQYAD